MKRIDAVEAREMVEHGLDGKRVQIADALPEAVYQQERLPGAVSLPLETLDRDAAEQALDKDLPVIVYCFDQHCDLSSRTANRLEQYGYDVYDLIGGRAAWTVMAYPTEGSVGDARRISRYVKPTLSVSIDATAADVAALGPVDHPVAVLGPDDILFGVVHPETARLPGDTPVERAMVSAPGTVRPDQRIDEIIEQLRKDHLDHAFVTKVSGELVGLVVTDELRV